MNLKTYICAMGLSVALTIVALVVPVPVVKADIPAEVLETVQTPVSLSAHHDMPTMHEGSTVLKVERIPKVEEVEEPEVIEETYICPYDNIELFATIVMAEAEGEPEEGQRLVIDVILNRVDSDQFPNSVHDVIFAPEQFTCLYDGRANECYPMDSIISLIYEEIEHRANSSVYFFRTKGFPTTYGTPLFQLGHHYFSGL